VAGCARRPRIRGHALIADSLVTAVAAFAAWLGAAIIVLADGRRGLATGIGLVAVGFTAIAWSDGVWVGGACLLVGGAVAVTALLRTGPQDWGLMPAGSTPRLILAVAGGILSLWVAASVTTGPGASLRFASLAVLGLMAGRLLQSKAAVPALAGAAGLAIALAGASELGPNDPGFAPYLMAALIAAGALLLPAARSHGA
jgi:hypothetical protein